MVRGDRLWRGPSTAWQTQQVRIWTRHSLELEITENTVKRLSGTRGQIYQMRRQVASVNAIDCPRSLFPFLPLTSVMWLRIPGFPLYVRAAEKCWELLSLGTRLPLLFLLLELSDHWLTCYTATVALNVAYCTRGVGWNRFSDSFPPNDAIWRHGLP